VRFRNQDEAKKIVDGLLKKDDEANSDNVVSGPEADPTDVDLPLNK
jgi:hypothetical protein